MAKILITGGSGLVGRSISEKLIQSGHEVRWLSREAGSWKGIKKFVWDVNKKEIHLKAFEGVDAIIHLAGSGIIDKRWTNAYKKEIIESRVKSSELLFETISKNNFKIKSFVGGSATGYYGSEISEHIFTENDPPGNDFLAEVCVAWENSYVPFINSGIRTTIIRTGVALSNRGGAYNKMTPPFKFGLGAAIGSGKQYFSWIHIDDLSAIFIEAVFNESLHGPYNGVGSEPVNNYQFSKQLALSFNKPFFLPNVPEFLIKMVLGERAVTVTKGLKVSNQKIKATGFQFKFEKLDKALMDLNS